MSPQAFYGILVLITPVIVNQDSTLRPSIPSEERLPACFRYSTNVEKEKEKQLAKGLKVFRYDTMKMLEIFSRTPLISKLGVKPSVYINELMMPTSERQHFLIQNNECIRLFSDGPPSSVFEKWDVKPRVIFFSNWQLRKQYEICFSIRNKYRMAISEVFELEEIKQVKRLASMVTAKYKVKFNPKELTDYEHTITLYGENESFPIYILAIGPRPMIDLPDRINFGDGLVNFRNEKIIPLKNIGQISATIVFETIGEVELDRQKLTLAPGENYALVLKLETKKLGYINAQIIVTYEKGERVYINVTANCKRGRIHLDQNEIRFEKTYIGLKSCHELTLHNNTEYILKFRWLRNKDLEIDNAEWKRVCGYLQNINDVNKKKLAGLEFCGAANEKEHSAVLDRVFKDETSEFRQYSFFMDSTIHIEPQAGTIWPDSDMNFQITFSPTMVFTYQTAAFLDVNGMDNRLKVTFHGEAIGPKIVLNVTSIDFGKCFICSVHRYGVILRNIGLIKGSVRHVPEELICGGEISCSPQEVELLPEEIKLIELNVSSNIAGYFIEDVWFEIVESGEKFRCTLQGEIINPRLQLDKHELDFGEVGLGFPKSLSFKIKNDSPIGVEIDIRVEGDGYMQAVVIDYDYDHMLPSDPKEFIISPNQTTIESGQTLTVEVKLISNTLRKHKTRCNIYFWDVLLEECSLDLTYESKTPMLVANPTEIVMRYAFTDYEYVYKITICNESELPTYFSIVPQQNDFNPYLIYRLENASGFLIKQSCQLVKVYIKVLTLKPCKERIKMKIFGVPYLINACTIRAFGMGPVVNPSSYTLNWGKIKILEENPKTFQLINVSPITAYYKITVVKRPDVWKVLEYEGSILPDESTNVGVVAKLRDSGKIKDKLWVEIAGSRDVYINISAYGFGMSIVTEPNIFPLYDIGKVFRKEKHNQTIKVTNIGTREHTLLFTTMQEIKKMTKMKAAQEQGTYFKLNPYRINLAGGETQEVTLSYKWDVEAVLEDTYYCYAIINNQGKRIVLGTCTIRATFTDPEFFVDPSEVHFRVDISHFDKEIKPLHQHLHLTSLWGSTLSVECKLNRPFSFGYGEPKKRWNEYLELKPNFEQTLSITFDPANLKSRRTRIYKDELQINYKGHTVKTFINLIGEINFPNLTIQTKIVDFDCIAPCSEGICQVQMKNLSPLVVHFDWIWEDSVIIPFKQAKEYKNEPIKEIIPPEQLLRNNSLFLNLMNLKNNLNNSKNDNIKMSRVFSEEKFSSAHSCEKNYIDKMNYRRLKADPKFTQQKLPSVITNLLTHKYFIEKRDQPTLGKTAPQFQNVLLDYERQFTSGIPFYASRFTQSSSDKVEDDSSRSLSSLDISNNLKKAIGLTSSTSSQSFPLEQVLPSDVINEEIIESHECLKTKPHLDVVQKDETPKISQVVDINPCQGVLEPQECLIVTFTFSPQIPMSVEGTAVCRVLGGPEEVLEIKGCSFPILYEVFPEKIIFGFGPFCEIWCSSLIVWNKSLKQIHISVTTVQNVSKLKEDNQTMANFPESVCIYPPSTSVKPFQVSFHRIAVYPGRVGEIELPLLIQIDNEEPFHILFVGYAMPNQIHLKIPHKIHPDTDEDIYHSIGRMTSEWFQLDLKDQLNIDVSESTLESILSEINDIYYEDDWDLLMTKNDLVPTIDDINMAYERFMCEKYSHKFDGPLPSHISSKKGCDSLPEFFVEEYIVDFGVLIAGTKALYGIPFINYGPKNTVVHVIPPKDLKILDKYGVIFKLVPAQLLVGYEEKRFDIFIRPPRDLLQKTREITLTFDFYFTVTCGPIIPVTVKALITQPTLRAPKIIEFEGIKVGYQRIRKFKLKNLSKVDCEWVAVIMQPNRTHTDLWRNGQLKNCPFTVKPMSGYLYPNHITVISVIFKPHDEVPTEGDIHFLANMNSSSVHVRLRGYGIEPKLLIKDVSFGYSVPYSEPIKKHLTVYNSSLFPLEVFIYKKDKSHKYEKKIFETLISYYGEEKISVPSQFYKTRMTKRMWDMYRELAETAIRKHIQDTANYLNIVVRRHFAKNQTSSDNSLSKKQSRRNLKKIPSKNWKGSVTGPGPLKKRMQRKGDEYTLTVAAIEELIWDYLPSKNLHDVVEDYIEFVKYFQASRSNLAAKDEEDSKPYQENVFKDGNAIIVHHSPKSHPGLFSLLMNKHTGMVPVSIDNEIICELEEAQTEESLLVRDILYNYYMQEKDKPRPGERDKGKISVMSVNDIHQSKPLKSIKDLVAFAISRSKPKKSDLKTKGSRESGGTIKSGKTVKTTSDKVEMPPTLLSIPKNYLQTILKRRLMKKMKKGIIIKSLKSNFFSSNIQSIESLINILKDLKNLNVVSLYTTSDMFLTLDKELLNLEIIEEFQNFSGQNILEARPSFIKLVGKEFYEQRKLLAKLAPIDVKRRFGSSKTTQSSKGSVRNSRPNIKKPKSKATLTHHSVLEAELKFATYQKELEGIRNILDKIERTKEFQILRESGNNKGQGLLKKPGSHKNSVVSQSFSKVQPKLDDTIGIPLWILYHYPYQREYQFSEYVRFLASDKTIYEEPNRPLPVKRQKDTISGKSYFIIDKSKQVDTEEIEEYLEDDFEVFKLNPIRRKIKCRKQHYSKMSEGGEYEAGSKSTGYPPAGISISSVTASSVGNALIASSIGIDSLMYSIVINNLERAEASLIGELESFMNNCKAIDYSTRQLIKPSRFKSWEVNFEPKGCRVYEDSILFGISGSNIIKSINIFAGCDIPDISYDPFNVFSKINDEIDVDLDDIVKPSFLLNKNAFHFGATIVEHAPSKERNFKSKSTLKFINSSNIEVKMVVSLINEKKLYDREESHKRSSLRKSSLKFKPKSLVNEVMFRKAAQSAGISGNVLPPTTKGKRSRSFRTVKMLLEELTSPDKNSESPQNASPRKKKAVALMSTCNSTSEGKCFDYDPLSLNIKVGQAETLNIYAQPIKTGSWSCQYLFSIENNPKIYTLQAFSNGISVHVAFFPRELYFSEVILYRSATLCFSMDNTSKVPLIWKIHNLESLLPQVAMSKHSGLLRPNTYDAVYVTYSAKKIECVPKNLTIGVYAQENSSILLQEHTYSLYLRSYSVDVSFYFEMSGSDHLEIGDIGVRWEIGTDIVIANNGINSVIYSISLNSEKLNKWCDQVVVTIDDMFGTLKADEQIYIKILFKIKGEISLKKVPIFFILIADYLTEEPIAKIPGYASLESHFSKFLLSPSQTIDFGDVELGSIKMIDLTLENIGKIDFNYKICLSSFSDEPALSLYGSKGSIPKSLGKSFIKGTSSCKMLKKMGIILNSVDSYLEELWFLKKMLNLQANTVSADKFLRKLHLQSGNISKNGLKQLLLQRNKINSAFKLKKRRQILSKALRAFPKEKGFPKNMKDMILPSLKSVFEDNRSTKVKYLFSDSKIGRNLFDGLVTAAMGQRHNLPPFEIEPSEGTILSQEHQTIKIYCFPRIEGSFEKDFLLKVRNASPECKHVPLTIKARCSVPKIDFENYESIFCEFDVVDTFQNSTDKIINEGMPFGVFSKQKQKLYFCNVIVNCGALFNIHFRSENQLPSSVEVSIHGDTDNVFSMPNSNSGKVFIPPYESAFLTLQFFPKSLTIYKATILFTLKTQSNFEIANAAFNLSGLGNMPRVELENVMAFDETYFFQPKLDYGCIHVGSSSRKMFSIKNVGVVIAEVLLELTSRVGLFSLRCSEEAMKTAVNEPIFNGDLKPATLFRINPRNEISVDIEFQPSEPGTYSSSVIVHTVYNPFEMTALKLYGEAFSNDVLISGSNISIIPNNYMFPFPGNLGDYVEYNLDFGLCVAMKKYNTKFLLKSYANHIIRFEFECSNPDIILIPSIGHIYQSSEKEIKAVLLATSPGELLIDVTCHIEGVSYKEEIAPMNQWDNSLKVISWLEEEKEEKNKLDMSLLPLSRAEAHAEEPECLSTSFHGGTIFVHVIAKVDLPVFTITPTNVNFHSSLVGQAVEQTIRISNESNVEARYQLDICDHVSLSSDEVPEIINFTFGKFDYNLNYLPGFQEEFKDVNVNSNWPLYYPEDFEDNLDNSFHEMLQCSSQISDRIDEWEQLKIKHLNVIYGKPVIIKSLDTESILSDTAMASKIVSAAASNTLLSAPKDTATLSKDDRILGTKAGHVDQLTQKNNYIALEDRGLASDYSCDLISEIFHSVFKINARSGIIKPHDSLQLNVTFLPRHIETYKSTLRLSSKDIAEEYEINVTGTGILPLCHVEIEENDYLTEIGVSFASVPGKTKAIVLTCMDNDVVIKKQFYVYNIAEMPYHFKWYCLKESTFDSKFICHTEMGIIPARGRKEMLFSFCPGEFGTFEALWVLCIKEFILQQPFVFVGVVRDPQIVIEPKTVILKPTLKGTKTSSSVKLKSFEESPIQFYVVQDSLFSSFNCSDRLEISPKKGDIMPEEPLILNIEFVPTIMKHQIFNPLIKLNKSKKVVSLKVVSKSFEIIPSLSCTKEDFEKLILEPTDNNKYTLISIGKVNIKVPYVLKFTLRNSGEMALYFECFFSQNNNGSVNIDIETRQGVVVPSNEVTFLVKITALQKVCFKEPLIVKVSKGPNFCLQISGNAMSPICHFSFSTYDFGICLIQTSDPVMNSVILEFSNLDSEPVMLETDGCKDGFCVNFKSLIIEPRAVHKILILFNPTEPKKYSDTLKFHLNSTTEHEIFLTGEGDCVKLELEKFDDRLVDFGLVSVGQMVSRKIPIVNKSRTKVEFSLHAQELLDKRNAKLFLEPFGKKVNLSPGDVCTINVSFHAEEKLNNFSCKIYLKAYGVESIIFVVKASIIDYQINLDQNYLFFGSTTIGCTSTLKVGLVNSGDIGTRFQMVTRFVSDVFVIKPTEGYSLPGSTTVIEVTFVPNRIMQYCNNVLVCLLENYRSLTLGMAGVGIKLPLPSGNIKFVTKVRQPATKKIILNNRSFVERIVHPIVEGEYFSGPEVIAIPPNSSVEYEIKYHPFTQTKKQHHVGSLFCDYNHGEGLLYKLEGSSLSPKFTKSLKWFCCAGVKKKGKILVENWTSAAEMFAVAVRCIDVYPASYFEIESNDVICVPSKGQRHFKLGITVYKECLMSFKVIFKNINSGEYTKYKINITVLPTPLSWPIKLSSFIREEISYKIPIFNPMDKRAIFSFRSPHPDIKPREKRIVVKPHKKAYLKIKYLPLTKGFTDSVKVEVCNYMLGRIVRVFNLEAFTVRSEKEYLVKGNLGVQELVQINISNPTSSLLTCFSTASSLDLTFSKSSFNIPPGKQVKMDMLFLPSQIGTQLINVRVRTNRFGTISIPVKGICEPPKPQGPFWIPKNETFKLSFQNVLREPAQFTCDVNSPEFQTTVHSFFLKPGKEQNVEVEFIKIKQSSALLDRQISSCKLTIWCYSKDKSVISWVYYLFGEM